MIIAFWVVWGATAAALLLGWTYFRCYHMTRPPLGVMNLWDVGMLGCSIVAVPYLYLTVPRWVVTGLFGMAIVSLLYYLWEPVLRARWVIWFSILVLLGADVGTAVRLGTLHPLFVAVNDGVLILAVAGLTNLWAQSGMKARDLALLAGLLAAYDMIDTGWLPTTAILMARLASSPLAPMVAWGVGRVRLEIGVGDLLLVVTFPLVLRKAFGRSAGLVALLLALGTIGAFLMVVEVRGMAMTLPTMTVLGPLMVAQYIYWRRARGPERTTRQYWS